MRLSTIPACLALAGILASCGGGDSSADVAADSNTGDAPQPSAVTADMGDFPIPVAPGAIEILGGAPSYWISYPFEDYDRVAQFYEDWVASQPEEFQRVDAGETLGVEITGVSWFVSDGSQMITIAEEERVEGEDADEPNTVVQLTAAASP
jgi:hypothetical protein